MPSDGYALTHLIQAPAQVSQDIEFSKIGLATDSILEGSFDEIKLIFSLPSAWELKPGSKIILNITNYFADLIIGQNPALPRNIFVGELSVWLNDFRLDSFPMKDSGDFTYSVKMDEKYFQNKDRSGLNELIFRWDASISCDMGIVSTVSIRPSSKLQLQYQTIAILPDLNDFPNPFFQEQSVEPQKVTILIPDQPTEGELQSALTVAAGFGKISKANMNVDLITFNQLGNDTHKKNNLVLIGTIKNLALLDDTVFSISIANQFNLIAVNDDGVVMEINSPWKTESVLLVITGKTESGVIKAATAVSSGALITSSEKNLAIVKDIYPNVQRAEDKVDISFSELNQQTIKISNYGQHKLVIPFTFFKSKLISPESYLDLYINHSQLIDYNQSGLWVSLNGIPLGSVRFSDQTSNTTLVRFIIPPSAIKSVSNKIQIETNLISRNTCSNPRINDHWITIFGDSTLHITTIQESSKLENLISIGDYPQPFILDEGLGSTMIILENDDLQSWKIAANLVFNLGAELQSKYYQFSLRFPNRFTLESSKGQQLLFIGLTSKIPFSTKINTLLPVPFNTDGKLQDENRFGIKYAVNKEQSLGYLELVNISTSPQSQALLVLGSNAEGLSKSGQVLLDIKKREKMLNSNFVLIQDETLFPEFIETSPLANSQAGFDEPQKILQSSGANLKQWTWVGLIGILVALIILIGTSILKSYRDRKDQKIQIPLSRKRRRDSRQTLKK